MKRFYTTMLSLAAIASVASAQQLPNGDFSEWKTACGDTEAFGFSTGMRTRPGIEPTGWNGSSVNQNVIMTVKQELVYKTEGKDGSCVKLLNNFVGAFGMGSVAPGFLTLGTPWVAANTDIANCDGGTYGGIDFTNRPDAIALDFKRVDTNDESSTITLYGWKGTYQSKVGMKNKLNDSRDNVDRAIMGLADDAIVTQKGELIFKLNHQLATTNGDWTSLELPIEYVGTGNPEKFNVVICAGDYYNRDKMIKNTEAHVDNVKLVYYSRLASLKVGDKEIALKDGQYNYAIYSDYMAAPEDKASFNAVCMGTSGSSTASVDYDKATGKAVITVTNSNEGGTDTDGEAQHVYTIEFKEGETPAEVVETKTFYGTLEVKLDGGSNDPMENTPVMLDKMSDGTYTLRLENFGGQEGANITVENITLTGDQLKGSAPNINIMGLTASAEVTGTYDGGDNISLVINCIWDNDGTDVPINVTFNGSTTKPGPTVVETKKFYGTSSFKLGDNDAQTFEFRTVEIDKMSDDTYTVRFGKFGVSDDYPNGLAKVEISCVTLTETQLKGSGNIIMQVSGGSEATIASELTGTFTESALTINCSGNYELIPCVMSLPLTITFNGSTTKPTPTVVKTTKFEGIGTYRFSFNPEMQTYENTVVELDLMSDDSYNIRLDKFGATEDEPDGIASISITDVILNGTELKSPEFTFTLNDGFDTEMKGTLIGTYEGGNLSFSIDIPNPDAPDYSAVAKFKGKLAAIGDIDADIDNSEAPVEYYNLQGVRCNPDNLTPGIYIRRQGKDVSKILVR